MRTYKKHQRSVRDPNCTQRIWQGQWQQWILVRDIFLPYDCIGRHTKAGDRQIILTDKEEQLNSNGLGVVADCGFSLIKHDVKMIINNGRVLIVLSWLANYRWWYDQWFRPKKKKWKIIFFAVNGKFAFFI